VDYPRYRKLGLPVTSTLMESLVKEFNLRVKGTEKFWNARLPLPPPQHLGERAEARRPPQYSQAI
jgi:hypothetical protein